MSAIISKVRARGAERRARKFAWHYTYPTPN
ncbi:hypothetical protein ABIA35_008420 [Catenulispora sp. MAP12-49]|jgi:hypothetical protein